MVSMRSESGSLLILLLRGNFVTLFINPDLVYDAIRHCLSIWMSLYLCGPL